MLKKNKNILILLSVGLILIVSMFFVFNNKDTEYKELPRVKLKEPLNNKQFALMLEQNIGKKDYQESSQELPTEGYYFNQEKSGCTDINGKKVENALSYNYEDYTINLMTSQTIYCYLYYDKSPTLNDNNLTLTSPTSKSILATITKMNINGLEYCFSLNNESSYECSTSNTKTYQVTSGSTSKVYAYVKINNNKSNVLNKSITTIKTITPLELVASKPNFLTQDLVGGMHRYQGLYTDDIKNYICLGDNCCKEESCPASSEDDMYRIIGITQSGEMKVIKKTAITDAVQWWSDDQTDIKWPESLIYQKLNGKSADGTTNYNLEDENSYYYSLDSKLKGLIVNEHSWLYGDTTSVGNDNGDTIYEIESGSSEATYYQKGDSNGSPTGKGKWSERIVAPLGLMYISDYYYAYKPSAEDSNDTTNSWIHLSHNQSTIDLEWTMSRYGLSPGFSNYLVWNVNDINMGCGNLFFRSSMRPTFFLSSEIELSGKGTLSEPFRISGVG